MAIMQKIAPLEAPVSPLPPEVVEAAVEAEGEGVVALAAVVANRVPRNEKAREETPPIQRKSNST